MADSQKSEEEWWDRYVHQVPRIDEERFHASVPAWEGKKVVTKNDFDRSCLVWNPNYDSTMPPGRRGVDEHLCMARTLTEQAPFAWNQGESSLSPLESDELALHYLTQHDGNTLQAQFCAIASASCGRERSRVRSLRKRTSTNSVDYRDPAIQRELYGDLAHSASRIKYPENLIRRSNDVKPETQTDTVDDDNKPNLETADVFSHSLDGSTERAGRRCGADRQQIKNRWQKIKNDADKLLTMAEAEDKAMRPHEKQLLGLLEKAALLPVPEQSPGENFVGDITDRLERLRQMLLVGRDWSARVRDAVCGHGQIVDLNVLVTLQAEELPLIVTEAEGLALTIEFAKQWKSRAASALEEPSELNLLRALLSEAQTIPVMEQQPECRLLQAKIVRAEALAVRLSEILLVSKKALAHSKISWDKLLGIETDLRDLRVLLRESGPFESLTSRVRRFRKDAETALNQTPDMRQLQMLINTGENLPVAFPDILEKMKLKLLQAEAWVERVRNAVPQKKTRKTAETDKVEFVEMKNLLDEVSNMQVDLKEREQMTQVVESAEDWISRVREALQSGEESTITALEKLLTESENIPVNMSEQKLLSCEIKARHWISKVRDVLYDTDKEKTRIEQLLRMLGEFEAIREAMPLGARAKKNYKPEEETRIKSIVSTVEIWKTKVKRATSSKGLTTEDKYRSLLDEAASIPVNLQAHTKSIETTLKRAFEWRETYSDVISVCQNRVSKRIKSCE